MHPSSDQVAHAIVAACRETGENPEQLAQQQGTLHARHYALHALHRIFPTASRESLARSVGCAGDGRKFWNNSVQQKFKMLVGGPRAGKRVAKWDEAAFERVIAAVRAVAPANNDEAESDPAANRASAAEGPALARLQSYTARPRPPVKLSAAVGGIVEPTRPVAAPGKRRLEEIMREAVINTQRMTPPPEPEPGNRRDPRRRYPANQEGEDRYDGTRKVFCRRHRSQRCPWY
jgi:hypothetical protein